ncbi:YaaA family protein [Agromyces aerolatus]|uniref:YaaA family protein n=1 Tax=Agromyces sp. LY-1074 TaxID=3074080 RepID=UPI00286403C3|nr:MULTISPECIES: peroxide stress protein YaaA [unclassified Agromyces]MDR5701294.1 peroxide stress protein YaaA [Agromyces sp. LY-1074]MDR5707552.1 peroxide stress protein YaaA [Agromyces sp. LY-1358]
MRVLLPPSETKRDGGAPDVLDVGALSFPSLEPVRDTLVDDVVALAADPQATMRALKLGPRQAGEVDRNAALRNSPTMPAIDRYTGVLYDALDAPSLDTAARRFAGRHVVVHSALFGLVGALDPIPAYRLSHDSRVPGARLKARWRAPIAEVLAAGAGLTLDLRSEGYAELGPLPDHDDAVFVRVVSEDGTGRRRALNHFNKQAKGRFTRALLQDRPALSSIAELVAWAGSAGFVIDAGTAATRSGREIQLVA